MHENSSPDIPTDCDVGDSRRRPDRADARQSARASRRPRRADRAQPNDRRGAARGVDRRRVAPDHAGDRPCRRRHQGRRPRLWLALFRPGGEMLSESRAQGARVRLSAPQRLRAAETRGDVAGRPGAICQCDEHVRLRLRRRGGRRRRRHPDADAGRRAEPHAARALRRRLRRRAQRLAQAHRRNADRLDLPAALADHRSERHARAPAADPRVVRSRPSVHHSARPRRHAPL